MVKRGTYGFKDLPWRAVTLRPIRVSSGKEAGMRRRKEKRRRLRPCAVLRLRAPEGTGKVSDAGYDQFPCVYTRIPAGADFRFRAAVTVEEYPKGPFPTGQEGFGIFLRDTMAPDGETGQHYSNMASVGMMRSTHNVYIRDGITADCIDHVRNLWLQREIVREEYPEPRRLRLELERTGNRLSVKLEDDSGDLLDRYFRLGKDKTDGDPITKNGNAYSAAVMEDAFGQRDARWQYIGFFAADGAAISVDTETVSLTVTSCRRRHRTGTTRPADASAEETDRDVPPADGPAAWQDRPPAENTVYVSPDGSPSGRGTRSDPLPVRAALDRCGEKDEIVLCPGVYRLTGPLILGGPDDRTGHYFGTGGASGRAVLDFGGAQDAVIVRGHGWELSGIDITNGGGLIIEGSGNHIAHCRAYHNRETGILIRHPDINAPKREWPSNNLVEQCVSFANCDPSERNADGFACKVAAGEGNRFFRCIAYLNADDGFDLFSKNRRIGAVSLEECESVLNGYLPDGALGLRASGGNGNGFKMGGSGWSIPHSAWGCRAEGNRRYGFTSNSNPSVVLRSCSARNNPAGNVVYYYHTRRPVRVRPTLDCSAAEDAGFDAAAFWETWKSERDSVL